MDEIIGRCQNPWRSLNVVIGEKEFKLRNNGGGHEGFCLWTASVILAKVLNENKLAKDVVEMGCGLGLPGMVCAAKGCSVTFVDSCPDICKLLKSNLRFNGLEGNIVCAKWQDYFPNKKKHDLLVASEVFYPLYDGQYLVPTLASFAKSFIIADSGRKLDIKLTKRFVTTTTIDGYTVGCDIYEG